LGFCSTVSAFSKRARNFCIAGYGLDGICLTKALWKYEPGYAESKTGKPQSDDVLSIKEEAEAVAAWLSGKDPAKDKKAARIHKIIEAGYFQEFFYYEIAATKSPYILLMLSEIQFERLINYVNRFH